MPVRQQVQEACTGKWQVQLFEAPAKAPHICLYGCCCICCASYQQRNELLDMTGEPYVCCAGLFPCGPLGQPCQDRSCLAVEACCCAGLAVSANRYMIQTRFDKENTPCDDFIITFSCLFYYVVQIAKCFCDVPDELELAAECLIMIVDGCMHAQQHIEIEGIKKNGYTGPSPAIMAALPPAQQHMVQQGKAVGGPRGVTPAMMGAAGGAAAMGSASAAGRPQTQNKPVQQQFRQAPAPTPQYSQQRPQQMQMGQQVIQVQCGVCRQVFGSPQAGVTVACPFCSTHNQIPANAGVPTGTPMAGGGMYGQPGAGMYGQPGGGMYGQPGGGMYGQSPYGPGYGQQGRPGGMGQGAMMAGGAAAGVLGGMMLADMVM
mmetsp:Transcript_47533/g.83570  ORF Transcript_47533/g.83570 Transcript_47533/m.83570 type:complete len:374 (+) Transcript_47533:72-1193(+)